MIRSYFLVALYVDQDVNCDATDRSRVPIACYGSLNVNTNLAHLGGVDLEGLRRRQGQPRRRVTASSSGNDTSNRFNWPGNRHLLTMVRCRSARARLVHPDHRRLRLYPPQGSSGEGVYWHQELGWPPVPGSPPNHRGHQHRRWRRDHMREAGDGYRDRAWRNRNGRGLVSEGWKGRRCPDSLVFFYFFNYFLPSLSLKTCCISFLSSLLWQPISPGRVRYFRLISHRINTS